MNKKLGNTQFRVPKVETLEQAYEVILIHFYQYIYVQKKYAFVYLFKVGMSFFLFQNHHQGKGKTLSKEEFQLILQEVVKHTGFTGVGAKDILFYMFGIPATALFIKQRILPNAVKNEIFIPAVTSGTVFVLAQLNKI